MKFSFRSHWPILILLTLPFVFLADIWLGGRMLFLRDFFFNDATMRIIHGEALRHGSFCLWYNNQCGIPGAAQPHSGAFYPPNWMFVLPWEEFSIRLWWTFHLGVSAVGWYALGRSWKLDKAPSLLASVAFTFGTYLVTWIEGAPAFTSMVWGPLVLMYTGRILSQTAESVSRGFLPTVQNNAGTIGMLSLFLGLQLLANGEYFFYTGLITGIYVVVWWVWKQNWRIAIYSMLLLGVALVLAAALSAPQWVLTAELVPLSERAGEVDAMTRTASAHPRHWLTFLLPFLYGRPGYPDKFWAPTLYEFGMCHCYLGLVPLVSALFAWLWLKGPQRNGERTAQITFLLIIAVFGLVMAAGKYTPFYEFFHQTVPGFGHLRFAPKFYIFVAYAIAMLGALGLQALIECKEETLKVRKRIWWITAAALGVFALGFLACLFSDSALAWLMKHPRVPSPAQVEDEYLDYAQAIGFFGGATAIFYFLAVKKIPKKWPQYAAVAFAFLNLVLVSRQIHPTAAAGLYTQRATELEKRMGNDNLHTFLCLSYQVQQYTLGETRREILDWATQVGATNAIRLGQVPVLNTCWMTLSRFRTLLAGIMTGPIPIRERLADLISLRYLASGKGSIETILWGNGPKDCDYIVRESALPRAHIVSNWAVVRDQNEILRTLISPNFDPRQTAVVEPLLGQTIPSPSNTNPPRDEGETKAFQDQGSRLGLEASTKDRALLVLNDTWYPGWKVKVDGVDQPIFRANYLFRGVFLEPGTHKVEFIYWPTHFTAALGICLLGLVGCAGLGVLARATRPVSTVSSLHRAASSRRPSAA